MDLGSSLRRRRGKGRPPASTSGDGAAVADGAPGRSRRRRRGAGPSVEPRTLAMGAAAALGGLLLGYLVATVFLFPAAPPPADMVLVPGVWGDGEAEAGAALAAAGLSLGQVEYLNHPEVDSGAVLGQSPLPGQLSMPGDSVRLVLSLGPERRVVPEVRRLQGDRAVALLQATGFRVRVDSIESLEPRGRILTVIPQEGEELTLPGEVNLRVSLGPPAVLMPDLLRLSEEEARDSLFAMGLVVSEVEEVFRFGRDQGRVVAQDPPPGVELERGTRVRLVVGRRSRRR